MQYHLPGIPQDKSSKNVPLHKTGLCFGWLGGRGNFKQVMAAIKKGTHREIRVSGGEKFIRVTETSQRDHYRALSGRPLSLRERKTFTIHRTALRPYSPDVQYCGGSDLFIPTNRICDMIASLSAVASHKKHREITEKSPTGLPDLCTLLMSYSRIKGRYAIPGMSEAGKQCLSSLAYSCC